LLSLTKKLRSWRISAILPYVNGRLLDIGCGTNELVRSYQGIGTGVDVHDWGDVDVLVEDSSSLPFPDGSFETITIIAALNHIPNRTELLHEACRLLSNKGTIILTMIPPNISYVWHKLRRSWDPDQKERTHHQHEICGITQPELKKHDESRRIRGRIRN